MSLGHLIDEFFPETILYGTSMLALAMHTHTYTHHHHDISAVM